MCSYKQPVQKFFLRIDKGNRCQWPALLGLEHRLFLVHSSTMKASGLLLDTPYLLNSSYILHAWPCDAVQLSCVVLPSSLKDVVTGCTFDDARDVEMVCVENVPTLYLAERVTVDVQIPNYAKLEDFLKVLKNKMVGHYVTEEVRHAVTYYGEKYTFIVRNIVHGHACLSSRNKACFTTCCLALWRRPLEAQENTTDPVLDESAENAVAASCLDSSGGCSSSELLHRDSQESFSCTDYELKSPVERLAEPQTREAASSLLPLQSHFSSSLRLNGQLKQEERDSEQTAAGKNVFCVVGKDTQFVWHGDNSSETNKNFRLLKQKKLTFEEVVGMEPVVKKIKILLLLPLQMSNADSLKCRDGKIKQLSTCHGVLLHGPAGTGKTMLAEAIVAELGYHCIRLTATDVCSNVYGESVKQLQKKFTRAQNSAPCVLLIDQLDILCPCQDNVRSEVTASNVHALVVQMDKLSNTTNKEHVIVIGMTRHIDMVDHSLKRVGRFDLDLETIIPDSGHRHQILCKLLNSVPNTISRSDAEHMTDTAHGFVGGDLLDVVVKAQNLCYRRTNDASGPVNKDDLREAFSNIQPSALKELKFSIPEVRWQDIGGMDEVKLKLRQAVEWPLTRRSDFLRMGLKPFHGCLLYGPPGCAKTMMAKALAGDCGFNFISVKGPELLGKYVGQSERAVKEVFCKARSAAPCVVFFDEIDSLAKERDSTQGGSSVGNRVVTQFLTELDGLVDLTGVTVVAATNRPDMIDKALLRPGRLDRVIYVPLPDAPSRKEIFRVLFAKTPVSPELDLQELVNKTEGFSGAELTDLVHQAALFAITESLNNRCVCSHHLKQVLMLTCPRTTEETVKFYTSFQADFRRATFY